MCRRMAWAAGVALAVSGLSGCGLLCNRYCDRERERCEHYNRGGCYTPPPVPACPPGCAPVPVPGSTYYAQPGCP